jgi:hypothetical protein
VTQVTQGTSEKLAFSFPRTGLTFEGPPALAFPRQPSMAEGCKVSRLETQSAFWTQPKDEGVQGSAALLARATLVIGSSLYEVTTPRLWFLSHREKWPLACLQLIDQATESGDLCRVVTDHRRNKEFLHYGNRTCTLGIR